MIKFAIVFMAGMVVGLWTPEFIARKLERMIMNSDATINRTPNPQCPACQQNRMHNSDEWEAFHPMAGTGSTTR